MEFDLLVRTSFGRCDRIPAPGTLPTLVRAGVDILRKQDHPVWEVQVVRRGYDYPITTIGHVGPDGVRTIQVRSAGWLTPTAYSLPLKAQEGVVEVHAYNPEVLELLSR